jgi:hypothetical protein
VSRYYFLESSLESSLEKALLESLGRREEEKAVMRRESLVKAERGVRSSGLRSSRVTGRSSREFQNCVVCCDSLI